MKTSWVVKFGDTPCDKYIGRPTIWSNPYRLGIDGNRKEVLILFEGYLYSNLELLQKIITQLPNKILGCHCFPQQCHGDLLSRIANAEQLILPLEISL